MNEEMGLAQQMGQARPMKDIDEIIAMLMQGMTPEDLVANGVPEELVMMAMQEVAKQSTQVPPEQAGLANAQVQAMPR